MNKIDHIDIVFENCDFCTIPANNKFFQFYLDRITKTIMSCNTNESYSMEVADDVELKFSKECLSINSYWENLEKCGNTLETYLKFKGLVSIHIYYSDTSIEYYVPYKEEDEAEIGSANIYQVNEFMDDGSCKVTIKKNR